MKLHAVALLATAATMSVAACATHTSSAQSATTVHLSVHLGLFGGPARPNGRMAADNGPDPGAPITVQDATGHTWRVRTNDHSFAEFDIRPGRYVVNSPTCGDGPRHVLVNSDVRIQLRCDVP